MARVFESAALGSSVLQVTALDKDKGPNAEIIYSIESGNVSTLISCSVPYWLIRYGAVTTCDQTKKKILKYDSLINNIL